MLYGAEYFEIRNEYRKLIICSQHFNIFSIIENDLSDFENIIPSNPNLKYNIVWSYYIHVQPILHSIYFAVCTISFFSLYNQRNLLYVYRFDITTTLHLKTC